VYGDSTPFLHEGNFIETIRHAVDCGVALLTAQHVIHKSIARAQDVDRAREVERARLESLGNTLKRAMGGEMATSSDRLLRTGARILETSRVTIESELVSLEAAASAELMRARRTGEQARASGKRALETFLVLHDLPGSEIALWLKATEESYAAESQVQTPFGWTRTSSCRSRTRTSGAATVASAIWRRGPRCTCRSSRGSSSRRWPCRP
jgi:hypothetical protein